jgi:16S rRNA (guanine966-N2)-methyltransferase
LSVVRIIGGQWKRTPIEVMDGPGLRPTPNRVRETLFNWLSNLEGKRVLDLFAGTGALGFEAASRGAAHVVCVENARIASSRLTALKARLNATQIDIQTQDALRYLQTPGVGLFDVIFLDPPFDQGLLPRVQPLLKNLIAPSGLVYVEDQHEHLQWPAMDRLKHQQAGVVHYHLFAAVTEP